MRRFPRRCGERSTTGTGAAASRAVGSRWARGITCVIGRRAARRRSRTSPCSVTGTTARSTRTATRWSDTLMARSRSGDRTADPCPRHRLLRRCPPILPGPSGRGMTRRDSDSTRGRRARPGGGSASTWAGRSTSCILWPREVWEPYDRLRRLADEPSMMIEATFRNESMLSARPRSLERALAG